MDGIIDRGLSVPLPVQLSDILRNAIKEGSLESGRRLDSVQKLSVEYGVSPVTVLRSFDILEKEGLILRVPVKGVFLKSRRQHRLLRACFAFPEKDFSQGISGDESWGLITELYRGLLAGSQETQIGLQCTYFEDGVSRKKLCEQLSFLENFDFVVFPGGQLIDLQNHLAPLRLTFRLQTGEIQPCAAEIILVDYDRRDAMGQLLGLLRGSGCRRVGVIAFDDHFQSGRARCFLDSAVSEGFLPVSEEQLRLDIGDSDRIERIQRWLEEQQPEFVFCDNSEVTGSVYEAAQNLGLKIGSDFMMTGIAGGVSFRNLLPHYTYLRIPRFEMGKEIIHYAGQRLLKKDKFREFPDFHVELVSGRTVRME